MVNSLADKSGRITLATAKKISKASRESSNHRKAILHLKKADPVLAAIIERVGPEVEVLAKDEGDPVLIRQSRILIATFHPELTSSTVVHDYFLRMVEERRDFSVGNDPLLKHSSAH